MIRVRTLSLLGLGAIALWAIPANAVTPPAVFKDAAGNVYIHTGVTAGSKVEVSLVGVGGTAIDLTTIATIATPPKCTGNAFIPATTTAFKESNGRIVLSGYTAGTVYNVKFNDLPSSANTTVNGCSFAAIRNTKTRSLPSQIKINGTSYTLSSLTVAEPPLCRRDAATGVSTRYTPSSW